MSHPYWPLFDLRIRSEDVEMRVPTDDDMDGLIKTALKGIHDPETMPFQNPWTDQPSPQFERNFARFHWTARASWEPDDWHLPLGVFIDGAPAGVQDVGAKLFHIKKHVTTGSWLGKGFQGKGYGKLMRSAMLHFVFEGLGAEVANSEAWADNARSIGVSRSLGYEDNGASIASPRGKPVETIKFRLTRQKWESSRSRPVVQVEGLEGCLDMFGAR